MKAVGCIACVYGGCIACVYGGCMACVCCVVILERNVWSTCMVNIYTKYIVNMHGRPAQYLQPPIQDTHTNTHTHTSFIPPPHSTYTFLPSLPQVDVCRHLPPLSFHTPNTHTVTQETLEFQTPTRHTQAGLRAHAIPASPGQVLDEFARDSRSSHVRTSSSFRPTASIQQLTTGVIVCVSVCVFVGG